MGTILVILGAIAIAVMWFVGIYNNLITLKNKVKNGWGQVDVQLQRRYDLIPNLVETVKGYMAHERGTLTEVIEARNHAQHAREQIKSEGGPTPETMQGLVAAESVLNGSLGRLFALSEQYPDLKANSSMQVLQGELSNTENKISSARESYNNDVQSYNTAQEVFPASFIAKTFGFTLADLFSVDTPEAKKAVKVEF